VELDYGGPTLQEYLAGLAPRLSLAGAVYALDECLDCGLIYQFHVPQGALLRAVSGRISGRDSATPGIEAELDLVAAYLNQPLEGLKTLDLGRQPLVGAADEPPDRSLSGSHRFDYIRAPHVFARLPRPLETLHELASSLAPGGLIRITVPDGGDFERRLRQADWKTRKGVFDSLDAAAPLERINCFDARALVRMAERVGLAPAWALTRPRPPWLERVMATLCARLGHRRLYRWLTGGTDVVFERPRAAARVHTEAVAAPDSNEADLLGLVEASALIERAPSTALPGVVSLGGVSACNDTVIEPGPPLVATLATERWAYGLILALDHAGLNAARAEPAIVELDLVVEGGAVGIMGVTGDLQGSTTAEVVVAPGQATTRLPLRDIGSTSGIVLRNVAEGGCRPRVTVTAVRAQRPGVRLVPRTHDLGFDLVVVAAPGAAAAQMIEHTLLGLAPDLQVRRVDALFASSAAIGEEVAAVRAVGGRVGYVTVIREPIDRAIAGLVESLPEAIPSFDRLHALGAPFLELLSAVLTAHLRQAPGSPSTARATSSWGPPPQPRWFFGHELWRQTGIDPLEHPVDRAAGFTLLHHDHQAWLLVRHEDLEHGLRPALAAFTGRRDVPLRGTTDPLGEPRRSLLRELAATLRVPEDLAAELYAHDPYLRHCYTDAEIAGFARRWTAAERHDPGARSLGSMEARSEAISLRGDALNTPIFIVSYNRVTPLRAQVQWLLAAGYTNIFVLDNNSTYPPLLDYYESLERASRGVVRVIRLDTNHGKLVLWEARILERLGVDSPYVYTDSDVIPDEHCPPDVVAYLAAQLDRHPEVLKVGLGLRIDDLPQSYRHREAVLRWERRYWRRPVARGLFSAPIDTTFALYRAGSPFAVEPALRTGFPYRARHEPWYADLDPPNDEQRFYTASLLPGRTFWSRGHLLPSVAQMLEAIPTVDKTLLHLGCGREVLPGWINVDGQASVGPDIVFDLNTCATKRLPLADASVDGFYACHAFEHIEDTLALMAELYRVARPDANLVLRLPYGGSDQAMEDPTHQRPYYPNSFLYYGQPAYSRADYDYRGDWRIKRVKLVVDRQLLATEGEPRLLSLLKVQRNLVQEMIVELVAVKPPRPRELRLYQAPPVTLSGSPLDDDTAF
jgi:predicted SAM-dependent methyltransferase